MTQGSSLSPAASLPAKKGGALRAVIAWLALIATVAGQAWLRFDSKSVAPTAIFLAGALLFALALRAREPETDPPALPAKATERRRRWLGIGLHVLALIGLAVGSILLVTAWAAYFYAGWGLLLAATTIYSIALRLRDEPAPFAGRWNWTEILALTVIVGIGAWLRLHRFGEFPDGYTTHAIEEQQTGLGGYRILNMNTRPWEFFLDYQLTALAQWLNPEPSFTPIRVPYVIVSILTIPVAHLLFRQLLSLPAALAATFLYSASSWNLLYSRCAHPIFPTNILVVIVLALLVHFARTRRLAVVPWIGLLCGYTLYSYAGYRGTPLFAAVFFAGLFVAGLWRWRGLRSLMRINAAGIVFAITLLASAAPIYRLLDQGPSNYYFESLQRSLANKEYYTADTWAFLNQRFIRIRDAAAIFMHFGDGSPTFNAISRPMLDPVTATLAGIGLFAMLAKPRRRYNLFFLFVPFLLLLVGTVFVQNLDVRRLGGLTVFVALAAGHAVEMIWNVVRRRPPTLRWVVAAIALVPAVGIVAWSYDTYFTQMADKPEIRRAYKDHYTTMIHFGREHGSGRMILLSSPIHRFFDPGYHYRLNYSWLIDRVLQGRTLSDVTDLLSPTKLPRPTSPRTVVVQRPFEAEAVAEMLPRLYPGTTCYDFSEADNPWVGGFACDIPDELNPAPIEYQLTARYWSSDSDRAGKPTIERNEPFIGYSTVPAICYTPAARQRCDAEWSTTLEVGTDADYQLLVEAMGPVTTAEVRVDGELFKQFPTPLHSGLRRIEIRGHLNRDWETGLRVSWIRDGKTEVIPFYRIGSAPTN